MPALSATGVPLYKPLSRHTGLSSRVKDQILEMISEGSLGPGDKLPPERELATLLGVSRNVVREGLRGLADMNIVEVRHGSGVFIASLDIESLIEPLAFAVSLEQVALRSLVEARLVFEPGITALAALRASAEDLSALQDVVERSRRSAAKFPGRFLEVDIEFHGAILRMCGNPFLTRIMESVGQLARSRRELTNDVPSMRAIAQADHEAIIAALVARDPQAARAAMQRHLEHVACTLATPLPSQ